MIPVIGISYPISGFSDGKILIFYAKSSISYMA
jgi:hypothetical protein